MDTGMDTDEGDKRDVEELKDVMSTVSQYLPMIMDSVIGPLKELINDFYDSEKSEKLAKNVANFYKELTNAGMAPDKASDLTKEYLDSINIVKSVVESVFKEKGWKK